MSDVQPRSRRSDLVVHDALDEILIYDKISHQAHCLNPVAAHVWRMADGATPVAVIASKADGFACSEEIVWDALESLRAQGLIDSAPVAPTGVSRRTLISLGTAAALVTTVLVPLPSWAQSGRPPLLGTGPQGCSLQGSQC